MATKPVFSFESFILDEQEARLLREGQEVKLRTRAFDVLCYLVKHANRLIPKAELLKAVWDNTRVSDVALRVCLREVRVALRDDAKAPRFIETISGKGFRFIAPIVQRQAEVVFTAVAESLTELSAPNNGIYEAHFVGREPELARLHGLFEKAQGGQRQIAFVTGEPGIGKTSLVRKFVHDLQNVPAVQVGWGQSVEFYGAAETYLPILDMLGGWKAPGNESTAIFRRYAPSWLLQLPALLSSADIEELQQRCGSATSGRRMRELGDAITAVATDHILVIVLEDLHWADVSTLDLLSYLAQRMERARLFLIGTYRPMKIKGGEHPLPRIAERLLTHQYCEEIPLESLGLHHIESYLSQRFGRHGFPAALVEVLVRRTEGNPLFLKLLVDYCLQQQLVVKSGDQWTLRESLAEWEAAIPDRARHMIERQYLDLSENGQVILEAASVVGEQFSSAAVAAAVGQPQTEVEAVCEELSTQGRFLRTAGVIEWPDGTLSGQYRFQHTLYQNVLYQRIGEQRRMQLHRSIGEREEAGYQGQTNEIAAELTFHFERGHLLSRAMPYLQQAAENVLQRQGYREAAVYVTRSLDLLHSLPEGRERLSQELTLHMLLGRVLGATKGFGAPEVEAAYARAYELCQHVGDDQRVAPILRGLFLFAAASGQFQRGSSIADHLISIAQHSQNPSLSLEAHAFKATSAYYLGDFLSARRYCEDVLTLPRREADAEALAYGLLARALWMLGYGDQALRAGDKAVRLARKLRNSETYPIVLWFIAVLRGYSGLWEAVLSLVTELHEHSTTEDLPLWLGISRFGFGWILTRQGRYEEGYSQMQEGIAISRRTGVRLGIPGMLAILVDSAVRAGQALSGRDALAEAFALIEQTHEGAWAAELHRLTGELLLRQECETQNPEGQKPKERAVRNKKHETSPFSLPSPTLQLVAPSQGTQEVEEYFVKAIDIARQQHARSWELRATMSLARLWHQQGKTRPAHELLLGVYSWFSEGFATTDLCESKALLDELGL